MEGMECGAFSFVSIFPAAVILRLAEGSSIAMNLQGFAILLLFSRSQLLLLWVPQVMTHL